MRSWYFKHWFLFILLPDYGLLPVQIGILKYVWPTSVRGSRSESRLTSASGLISGPCIRYVVQMCRWVLCTGLPWLLLVTIIVLPSWTWMALSEQLHWQRQSECIVRRYCNLLLTGQLARFSSSVTRTRTSMKARTQSKGCSTKGVVKNVCVHVLGACYQKTSLGMRPNYPHKCDLK